MALATLSIDIVAKLASLEAGMDKAARIAAKNAAEIEARYARIGDAVRSVAGIVGTAFAGFSMVQFVRNTTDGLDALNDLKDSTGASIENISALEDVALRTGTSFESMSGALVKFNKVLSEAKPGSDIERILKSLNLDAKALQDLDPAEALRQTAVALASYADDGNKARIVQQLFGKSVQEVAPFLKDLAAQGELVAKVTTRQAEEAEKFNNQLASLRKNSLDTARALTSALLPALNNLFDAYKRFGGLSGTVKAILGLDELSQAEAESKAIANAMTLVGRQLERFQAMADRGVVGASERVKELRAQMEGLQKRQVAATQAMKAGADKLATNEGDRAREDRGFDPRTSLPGDNRDNAPKASTIDEASRALAQYVAQLDRELQKTQDISEEQKALNFLKSIGTLGEVPQVRALVLGLAAQNDQLRDQADLRKLAAEAGKDSERQRIEAARELKSLLEQTPTEQYGKLVDLTAQLDAAFIAGTIDGKRYAEALALIDKSLAAVEPATKKAAEEIDEFTKEAARNIQDALGDTILATLKGDFDSIGRLWGNMIQKMIAEALAAKLGQALLGDFAKTGQIGGFLGPLFKAFGFHQGGIVGQGGTPLRYHSGGVAGLAPDEVPAVLRRGEEVLTADNPRHRNNQTGGVTIVNNVAAGVTRNEMLAALQMAMNAMRGEFKQTLRAAGVA